MDGIIEKKTFDPGRKPKVADCVEPSNGSEFRTLLTRTESTVAGTVKVSRPVSE